MGSKAWRLLLIAAILLLAGGVVYVVPSRADTALSNYEVLSVRKADAKADFAVVTDVLTVTNRGNVSLASLNVKMGAAEYESLYSMSVEDSAGRGLSYSRVTPVFRDYAQLRIDFSSPLKTNETLRITVSTVMRSLVRLEAVPPAGSFNRTMFPTLLPDVKLGRVQFELVLPSKASIVNLLPSPYTTVNQTVIKATFTDLEPDSVEALFVQYSYTSLDEFSSYVVSPKTVSKVYVGSDVEIESQITLKNVGKTSIGVTPRVRVCLPAYVKEVVSASDFAGDLAAPMTARDDRSFNVTLTLRYNIAEGQVYVFNLRYRLESGEGLVRDGDTYNVTLSPVGFYEPLVIQHVYTFVLPEYAGGVESNQPISAIEREADSILYSFEFHNGSAYIPITLNTGFYAVWYRGILKPLFYAALIYISVVAVGAVVWHQIPKAPKEAKVVSESLRKLCDLYDEKTSLRVELDRMEDSLRRGKVSKPIYDRRKQEILRSFETIDRQLGGVKEAVRKEIPKHSRTVDELERTDAEYRTLQSSVDELRGQYEVRRVSRKVYEDLMYEHERKTVKLRSKVDTIVISLREELG